MYASTITISASSAVRLWDIITGTGSGAGLAGHVQKGYSQNCSYLCIQPLVLGAPPTQGTIILGDVTADVQSDHGYEIAPAGPSLILMTGGPPNIPLSTLWVAVSAGPSKFNLMVI